MNGWVVFPAKYRLERITFFADFDNLLHSGETLTDISVSAAVFSGVDPSPANILVGSPGIVGTKGYQKVRQGEVGVIYELIYAATTSEGRELTLSGRLAIIIDAPSVDPIVIPYYFTSLPYPIEFADTFQAATNLVNVNATRAPIDEYEISVDIISGELKIIRIDYDFADEYEVDADLISGQLRVIRIDYDFGDDYGTETDIVSGELVRIVIHYSNWPPDEYTSSVDIISGSLYV